MGDVMEPHEFMEAVKKVTGDELVAEYVSGYWHWYRRGPKGLMHIATYKDRSQ